MTVACHVELIAPRSIEEINPEAAKIVRPKSSDIVGELGAFSKITVEFCLVRVRSSQKEDRELHRHASCCMTFHNAVSHRDIGWSRDDDTVEASRFQ